jgi:hypothetical protein
MAHSPNWRSITTEQAGCDTVKLRNRGRRCHCVLQAGCDTVELRNQGRRCHCVLPEEEAGMNDETAWHSNMKSICTTACNHAMSMVPQSACMHPGPQPAWAVSVDDAFVTLNKTPNHSTVLTRVELQWHYLLRYMRKWCNWMERGI